MTIAVGKDDETAVEGTDYAAVADFDLIIPAEQASGSATFEIDPTDNDIDAENKILSVEGDAYRGDGHPCRHHYRPTTTNAASRFRQRRTA